MQARTKKEVSEEGQEGARVGGMDRAGDVYFLTPVQDAPTFLGTNSLASEFEYFLQYIVRGQ